MRPFDTLGKEEAGRVSNAWRRERAAGGVQQCGGLCGSGGGQIPWCHFANIFVYSASQSGLASPFSCSWPRSRVDQQRGSEAGTRSTGSFTSPAGTSLSSGHRLYRRDFRLSRRSQLHACRAKHPRCMGNEMQLQVNEGRWQVEATWNHNNRTGRSSLFLPSSKHIKWKETLTWIRPPVLD